MLRFLDMSVFRWMSLTRSVSFLFGAALFAVAVASAQSSPSNNPASPASLSPDEASSSNYLPVGDDLSGAPALAAAASAVSSGGGAAQEDHGWKHNVSNNFAVMAGAGFNAPVGNDVPYLTWGGNFSLGGGLHLSNRFAILAEYQFMDDKLPGALIAATGTQGGNAHIWSLTLDPVIDLFPKHDNSAYITGGYGFYRKLTSFTEPVEEEECTFYCSIFVENATVSHFSSNQGGGNLGIGLTHRIGGRFSDSKTRLYAEARYVFIDTPPITSPKSFGSTEVLPVTFGVRW
jgi:hypothetical protein